MNLVPIIFGLLVMASVISLVGFYAQTRSARIRKRLQTQKKAEQLLIITEKKTSFLPSGMVKKLEDLLGLTKDSLKIKEVRKSLAQAGFDSDRAVTGFMGIRLGLCLALPILALPYLLRPPVSTGFFLLAEYVLFAAGYFAPLLVLSHLGEVRKRKIREELPDALDLMVVCVEAGQGLNAAIKRVADELMASSPHLPGELLKVNLEINAGQDREQALRHLAERTGVEEVASLCNILIQSERFGTSIAQTLKVQSEALRTTRRLKLEEQAAKTPVKLVFPLILFIFPAILVVILGPAIIRVSSNFFK
ncbi:MAG: type II secretion system F family protein [Deltaproteobacteria bacterium]|nr:type II secretion system F family protein [Deltaproteobacteria bacterium]